MVKKTTTCFQGHVVEWEEGDRYCCLCGAEVRMKKKLCDNYSCSNHSYEGSFTEKEFCSSCGRKLVSV